MKAEGLRVMLKALNKSELWQVLEAIRDEGEARGWGSDWWEPAAFYPPDDPDVHGEPRGGRP